MSADQNLPTIAVISKDFTPSLKSSKYNLLQRQIFFENPQQYLNEIVKYCMDNQCVGYLELGNGTFHENVVDELISPEDLSDGNISFIYCDYSVNGIPVLNTSSKVIQSIPIGFIKINSLIQFGNIQAMLQQTITKHIPKILMYA